jgi:NAD(P)-dependent dehydrogenase (short-subunit alcohol dehydrogenase family)
MEKLLDLTGKVILITGGCGAIGRVVVQVLAEHGATVIANDIVPEDEAVQVLASAGAQGPTIGYCRADATQPDAVHSMFQQVEERYGLPNIVCCHAGMAQAYPIDQYPLEGFDAIFNLNVRSSFLVAQTAVRGWLQHNTRGHLIFTTSWVQDVPWPEITPYNATKASLKAMMRGFARELAPKGIRANAIAPGIVAVGMAKRQWDTEPAYRARAEKAIPLGYMQPPETVAHAFLFLCSDMASYMTGSVLLVDGGCSLYPMDGVKEE